MDETIQSFGFRNFGAVELGDTRRTQRLATLVDTMCRHPGGTLPDKLNRPADLRAFYRLMNRPEVTHQKLIASHAAAFGETLCVPVWERTEDLGIVPLLIGKAVVYAPRDLEAGSKMTTPTVWRSTPVTADVPPPQSRVRAGSPWQTVFASSTSEAECEERLRSAVVSHLHSLERE